MSTPRLGAPELSTSQASKEATVNEAVRYIEAGSGHFIFKDRDLATPPGSPADGDCYLVAASPTGAWSGQAGKIAFRVNTAWAFITVIEGFTAWVNDENVLIGYDGAAWNVLASPSGTYIPTSYLDTDGTLAANSDAKIASQKATKTYIDAKVAGLSWKQAVRAATTANGTLASAFENGDAIDGVTLATGDRILIKNQSSGAENGIYTVNASGAPTRATDADAGSELVNATVYVSEGTTNADTQWTCTNNATPTLGATSLAFAQLATGGGSLQAANNLSDVASASTARTNLGLGTAATLAQAEQVQILVSDPNGSAITTGDGKAYFRIPTRMNGMDLVSCGASVSTVSSSGLPTVQLRRKRSGSDVDMLSTKISIDASEVDSSTAATAPVINTSNDDVATGDQIYIDIDVAGTGAKGLIVTALFQLP